MSGEGLVALLLAAALVLSAVAPAWFAWRGQDSDRRNELLAERAQVPARSMPGWLVGETVANLLVVIGRPFGAVQRPSGQATFYLSVNFFPVVGSIVLVPYGLMTGHWIGIPEGTGFVALGAAVGCWSFFIEALIGWRRECRRTSSEVAG